MENKNLDIFYFSSTHWDREWYQDFQGFRYRLVKMVNKLLALLDSDAEFQTFHFDGQTIAIEDYDRIKPGKAEKVYISAKEKQAWIMQRRIMLKQTNMKNQRTESLGCAARIITDLLSFLRAEFMSVP